MKKFLVLLSVLGLSSAYADTPTLNVPTEAELNAVMEDFNTSFTPTTVSPASNLGKIWGLEVGLIAGMGDAPGVQAIDSSVDELPSVAFLASVGLPFGLGIDVTAMPVDAGDFTYDYKNVGVRWTFTDVLAWPVDIKLRGNVTTAEMTWTQSGGEAGLKSELKSFDITISKSLILIEPYIGAAYIEGDTSIAGTVDIAPGLGYAQKNDKSFDDSYYFAGIQFNLLFLKLAAEYSNPFGNDRMMAKLSFKI